MERRLRSNFVLRGKEFKTASKQILNFLENARCTSIMPKEHYM